METIQFSVQGSAAVPYEVTFIRDEDGLIAVCTCSAGTMGASCKHRVSIFEGNRADIVSANIEQVATVASWLSDSPIAACLDEITVAERELERAKKQVSAAKKRLGAVMAGKQ
ncbi:hypothetical protein BCF11_5266 [Collimonas sp. PA-H2]|uniref:hypothetical protein n=1 Tax=Collimonas sp. PA-H2 TaxID=1881062 RepID=UPI000C01ECDD|nr:hypothetical protein [Collimonas sp. PA-H2]PFH04483.1 hypothetical protein BCF11_5266 [Collimonas sp. PA-H2]